MGAVSQVMADGSIHHKAVQTVRIKNHPPYGANKFKRLICGDPVKDTIFRMKAFPEAKDVQEECCIKLAALAEGEFYNGLVGEYGGIQLVMRLIELYPRDSLLMYAAIPALTQFAQNGPNAEILRNLKAEQILDELRKHFREDEYLQKDCEEFLGRIQETGITLAKEYVEHAVIEEDVAALLKYMRRYYDLVDVVEYGMGKIEAFLGEDESNVTKFIDGGDLTTFLMIIRANKSHFTTMYHVFSILYILAGNPGMSSEIGKAGLLKATLEMIREKRSGTQPELFQVAIFALNRMCLLEINAILFHKLCGDVLFDEIDQDIKEDKYDYPVILPFRLREVVRRKEALLKKDEDAARARHPDRSEVVHDRALYEKESLIQALVLKRPPAVITQKKDMEKWAEQGVVFSGIETSKSQEDADWIPKKTKKSNKVLPKPMYASTSNLIEIQQEGWDPSEPEPPLKGGQPW